jgi:hypothetical protein
MSPPWNLPEPRTFSWPIEQNTGGRGRRNSELGGVAEGVGSRLGADQLPPFHDYVILEGRSGRSAYAYAERVAPEYGVAPDYRYAIANQRTETTSH